MDLLAKLLPPTRWVASVVVLAGALVGMALYAFYVANAPSYLSDNPRTCVNCHIMAPQYSTWFHSSHLERAHCNDCHTPNDNMFNHYIFKMLDGLRNSAIFTVRGEPQVIHIKEAGASAVQSNCVRCHSNLLKDDKLSSIGNTYQADRTQRKCWTCHRETPHGRVNSLASAPFARVPLLKSPVPQWLRKQTSKH